MIPDTRHSNEVDADAAIRAVKPAPFLERLLLTSLGDLIRGRVTGRRSVRAAIAQPDLPELLQKIVDDVVKRTRLWRSERRTVARELSSHFEDGLRAGRSTEELVESFGDAAQAALLIRRARKRLRPLPWQAFHRFTQAMALLLALVVIIYIAASARFFLSSPTPTHNYLAELNEPLRAIPEGDRAWPIYREALLVMEATPVEHSVADGLRPGEEGWDAALAWLARNERVIGQLRQAAMKPSLGYTLSTQHHPEDRPLWERVDHESGLAPTPVDQPQQRFADHPLSESLMAVLLPHLAQLRKVSGVLVTDAFAAAANEDGARAAADLRALINLSRQLREGSILISDLVSVAILWRTFEAMEELLTEHAEVFTEDDLISLAHELAHAGGGSGAIQLQFEGERLFFRDFVQRAYSAGGLGGGHITPAGVEALGWMAERGTALESVNDYGGAGVIALGPFFSLIAPSRDAAIETYDRLLDLVEAEAALPLWQRGESRLDRELAKLMDSPIQSMRYRMVTGLIPAINHGIISAEFATQARDGLLAAIALRIHFLRHGQWPDSLDVLSPRLLPAVPRDRYDGGPLKYIVKDGVAMVYSVGVDRDDDGGRLMPFFSMQGHRQSFFDQHPRMWLTPQELARRIAVRPGLSSDAREVLEHGAVPDADWVLWMSERTAPGAVSESIE